MFTSVFSRASGLLSGARTLVPESSSEQEKTMTNRIRAANDSFECVVFNDTRVVLFFPADVVPRVRRVGTLADVLTIAIEAAMLRG